MYGEVNRSGLPNTTDVLGATAMSIVSPVGFGTVTKISTYVFELYDPNDGKVKQFSKETSWMEAQGLLTQLREDFNVEAIRLGVVEPDGHVRELFSTGSISREEE